MDLIPGVLTRNENVRIFPTPWKTQTDRWQRFQPLGKRKQTAGNISDPLEKEKDSVQLLST